MWLCESPDAGLGQRDRGADVRRTGRKEGKWPYPCQQGGKKGMVSGKSQQASGLPEPHPVATPRGPRNQREKPGTGVDGWVLFRQARDAAIIRVEAIERIEVFALNQRGGHEQAQSFALPGDLGILSLSVEANGFAAGPVVRGEKHTIGEDDIGD